MKVIHLISGGDTGGAKTHVHTLLQGLNKQIQADMVCFTDGPFVQEARDLGIRVDVLSQRNPLAARKILRKRIRAEGYDLIHCHGARGNLMGALLKHATGLPVITTVHSDPKLDYMGRPLSRLTFGTANSWALHRIPYRIGVSDAMADLLISRGFNPQQTFVIYNGLDYTPRQPPLGRQEFLASLGLNWPEDAVIVGIAARLNPVKDMGTLLRGFTLALAEQPKLRLLIAGDGPEEARLRELAAQLDITEEVCFAGWLSDTDSFYHAIDINTLTSLSETFSYAITEGARFALPTVASRVGGIPFLVENRVTGFLFEPRDYEALGRHLAVLAADGELRRRLGEQLLEKARAEFSIESTIRRQLDIYETVLRRHARPKNCRHGLVICGSYGLGNTGDEAILEAILQEVHEVAPEEEITVLSRNPAETALLHRTAALHMFNFPGLLRAMGRAKLYINGGGSLIQDATSRRSLWYYLFTLHAARRRGCKALMYGCGIGPVKYAGDIRLTRRVLNRCVDVITLRDDESAHELERFGVTRPRIILAADPVLTLQPAPEEEVDALMEKLGLSPQGLFLGVCLRSWPGFSAKVSAFTEAVRYAQTQYGLTPVFLSVNHINDGAAANQVITGLEEPFCAVNPPVNARLALGLMARMQAVISMRLHGLIFAVGQGIPLVGVAYDPKVSSFLSYMGQELYQDLDDITGESLRALLDRAMALRDSRDSLTAAVERLRVVERNNPETLRAILNE